MAGYLRNPDKKNLAQGPLRQRGKALPDLLKRVLDRLSPLRAMPRCGGSGKEAPVSREALFLRKAARTSNRHHV